MKRCPRCFKENMKEDNIINALSRRDNKTYICSQCGMEEAMIDAGLIKDNFLLSVDKIFTDSIIKNKKG